MKSILQTVMLGFVFVVLTACGGGSGSYHNDPAPPPPEDKEWLKIKVVIDHDCGKCHNGTKQKAFDSSARFKSSVAKAKLTKGLMPPPPATISVEDKQALLVYLDTTAAPAPSPSPY